MSVWKECRIGQVVELEQGLAINKKSNHLIVEEGLPLLRITDLINNTESQFIDKNRVPEKFISQPNDVIYTRTGQVGLVFMGRKGVIHNNCFRIIPNDEVNPDYLYWFLKQDAIREYAMSVASGAAQQDLNHDSFKSTPFLYPEKLIQKKITAVLSAYDDLIENNNKRIALLEKAAEEIYREWFVRLRFPGWETAVFHKGIPEGWSVKELQDVDILIVDGDRGKNYPKKAEFSESGYCLFLNTGNIKNDRFDYSNCDFISEQKDSLLRKGRLQPKDIVLTTRGTVGRIAYHSETALYKNVRINSGMVIIRSDSSIEDSLYWYHVMKSPLMQEQYKLFSSGSAQPQLPIKDLKRIKILFPEETILKQFCELVFNINTQMEKLLAVNWKLTISRDLLLARLISGKLPVDDLDIQFPPSMMATKEMAHA